ncbi:Sugar/inositol transporter [Niveomyces insectorum RCEF 264]|uniref:Sugar/inositol transporter n=1 Tax=Niveomyces insectorum RCEF 264 TaxID=1081102 RepID=A0A167MBB0_9HYPO|nr:Sugar/inositol transporter [Niveomyces insectorum RCEF 264]
MAIFAMGWRRPDNIAGSAAPAIMVGFFVATGGLLFGYDTGTINGILAMDSFLEKFADRSSADSGSISSSGPPFLTAGQQAIIISMLSVGTVLGSLLAAPAGDIFGRRKSLIASVGVFVFGVIFQICSTNIPTLLVGRFFAGVGVGTVSVLVPLYQSEMAPKWIRGTLVCAYQLFITVGLLAASVVNLLTYRLSGAAAYRIPMGLQLTWACVLSLGLLILPETPRYLVKRGRKEAAALSLSRLRRLDITHPALIEELAEIIANHEYELALGPDTYKDIIFGSPHLGRRTLTGCVLQILQQLTGVNFIMYYGTSFFRQAGVGNAFTVSLIMNIVNTVSTIPGLFVVESWGRRRLLMVGAAGMGVSQLLIASFAAAAPSNMAQTSMQILVIFVAIYIFFFAASWGPVAWVVTSEIYPLKVRAKSMSVSTAANWVLNFAIAYSSPFMTSDGKGTAQLGARVFFIWGAFCIVAVFFVYFMVYETSKISLEQIDEMYERVPKAWHSRAFEPSWSFQQMRDFGFSESGIPPEVLNGDVHTPNHDHEPHTNSTTTNTPLSNLAPTRTAHSDANSSETSTTTTTTDDDSKMLSSMANVDLSY